MDGVVLDGAELDDLVLLLDGWYPSSAFGDADGSCAPALSVVLDAAPQRGELLNLLDSQGTPLARLKVRAAVPKGQCWSLTGQVTVLRQPSSARLGHLRSLPGDLAPEVALAVLCDRPPTRAQARALRAYAASRGGRLAWLAVTGHGSPRGVSAPTLQRCLVAVALEDETVMAIPLPSRAGESVDVQKQREAGLASRSGAAAWALLTEAGLRVGRCEDDREVLVLPDDGWQRVLAALDDGREPPTALDRQVVARAATEHRGPATGVVVLMTGLSGSGKSTVARVVADLLEDYGRSVTLLDGDEVRQMLSAGLGFSRSDRDLNVRRIGFVGAEVARHGGIAIAAPIAPYAASRAAVRRSVEAAGGRFLLVHVSTPLKVCEARDRKGLYAAAREGTVTSFTGVSDPYESPLDADVVVDTTDTQASSAAARVVGALLDRRWLA